MRTIRFFSITLIAVCCSIAVAQAQSPAQNKQTALKILAAIDAGDINAFASYLSPNMIEHYPGPPGMAAGASDYEKAKALIASIHAGFPDTKQEVIKATAEGDMVMVYSYFNGTNTGSFMGMPATNKKVHAEQVDIVRFDASGKCVEHWGVMDQLSLLQQLGVIPADNH